ncbi:MAG TPA: hypothetical protein VFW44_14835 [Bryobacteraceae bacterium]|nr:hypothetical protein [Bryobacteraceae bacterium]
MACDLSTLSYLAIRASIFTQARFHRSREAPVLGLDDLRQDVDPALAVVLGFLIVDSEQPPI